MWKERQARVLTAAKETVH